MNNRNSNWESDSYLKLYKNGNLKYSGRMASYDSSSGSGNSRYYYKYYYIKL